jgi:beta-glucosidase
MTSATREEIDQRVADVLQQMTLEEKIGQLALIQGAGGHVSHDVAESVRSGRIGAVLNEVDPGTNRELQRIAREESRLGIPLLIGRDVIHGFKTVFPIPLGQAATWHPELVEQGAHISAIEASATGVNWTFAPMLDIGRDPRWGRVAECLGEDPYLASVLGAAMVRGFQGENLAEAGRIAACAKHFAGYGASESGRDYNTTNIPEGELRNVHLPAFRAALDAGAATVMTSFSDLNGVPATANALLLRTILREEWGFDGFVVSDWESVRQLAVHGLTADDCESAFEAANAGCDMEMASDTYANHLAALVHEGRIAPEQVDAMTANVLRTKFRLGLFDTADEEVHLPEALNVEHLRAAYEAAVESVVLLKNDDALLPLSPSALRSVAVIGPLADDAHEQLGTWVFDGVPEAARTILPAIRLAVGAECTVHYARALETSRSRSHDGFAEAVAAAEQSEVAVLVLGEEAILSGEAHCRADITLPGAQDALIRAIAATGTPIVLVVLAGRALALESVVDQVQAILYAWHPGTMGGPAIADLLMGVVAPSGRLPVTMPRVVGQIPIYYGHRNTGKPVTPASFTHIDHIPPRAGQVSVGNTSFHLDVDPSPLYPFGYGLSYSTVIYETITVSASEVPMDGTITISACVVNTGSREVAEVVQLYTRDLVGSVTRPVRELKGFSRVVLQPGERHTVHFHLVADDLAFVGRDGQRRAEPGHFHAWIGGDATASLRTEFSLVAPAASLH